jgi:hypothetical protein
MQAQAVKPQATSTKSAVSQQQSVALIRNLIRAGVSEVSYLRNLFVSGVNRRGARPQAGAGGSLLHVLSMRLAPLPHHAAAR